jgi:hypothetical protein
MTREGESRREYDAHAVSNGVVSVMRRSDKATESACANFQRWKSVVEGE